MNESKDTNDDAVLCGQADEDGCCKCELPKGHRGQHWSVNYGEPKPTVATFDATTEAKAALRAWRSIKIGEYPVWLDWWITRAETAGWTMRQAFEVDREIDRLSGDDVSDEDLRECWPEGYLP